MRCRLAITNLTKFPFKKVTTKGSKMAQKVKLLATKLNDPSSVPKIYMLEGKNRYYDPPSSFSLSDVIYISSYHQIWIL